MDKTKRRQTAVYLTEEERGQLERLAQRDRRSISFYVRQIILEHLRRAKRRDAKPQKEE